MSGYTIHEAIKEIENLRSGIIIGARIMDDTVQQLEKARQETEFVSKHCEELRLDIAHIVDALLMISDGIATVAQLETWLKHKGYKS